MLRLDPSTGKVERTYGDDLPAPLGCEGIGATHTALWVCLTPGTYVRLTLHGRTRTAHVDGYPDQLRIPAMDGQLWLIGKDRTTLHSLDATSGRVLARTLCGWPATISVWCGSTRSRAT